MSIATVILVLPASADNKTALALWRTNSYVDAEGSVHAPTGTFDTIVGSLVGGVSGDGGSITNINGTNIQTGTIGASKLDPDIVTNVLSDGMELPAVDMHLGTNVNGGALTGTVAAVDGAAITALTAANLTGLITIPLQSAVVTNEQILTFTSSFVALTNVDAAVITNVLAAPGSAGKLVTVVNVGTNDIEIVVDTTRTNVLDVFKDNFTILSINATEWAQVGATNNVK